MAQEIIGSAIVVLLVVGFFWWPTIKSVFTSQFCVPNANENVYHRNVWAVYVRQGFGIFAIGLIPLVATITFLNCMESTPSSVEGALIATVIVSCVLTMVFGLFRMINAIAPN